MPPEENDITAAELQPPDKNGDATFSGGRVMTGVVLSWLGALICLLLVRKEAGVANRICSFGSGCDVVLSSRFATIRGVPLPWLGLLFYVILFVLLIAVLVSALKSRRVALWSLAYWASVAGITFSALLMYAQFGILRAFCPLCTSSAVVMAGLVVVLSREESVWGQPDSGFRASGWALTTMAILSGAIFGLVGGKSSGEVIASVDGQQLAREQMEEELALPLERLNHRRYELEEAWIQEKVDATLLTSEANQLGTSPERLLSDQIGKEPEISAVQIEAALAKKSLQPTPENTEAAREELMTERRERARMKLVTAVAARHRVDVFLRRPKLQRMKMNLSTAKISGPANAPVQLVVFSDFQCPFCAQLAPILERIRAEFPEKVMVAFRYFPLESHARAVPAAIAAECAAQQGGFWEYHDQLFAEGGDLSEKQLVALAEKVGIDGGIFEECRRGDQARKVVESSLRDAIDNGLEGAPAIFLNGIRMAEPLNFERLAQAIQKQLKANSAGSVLGKKPGQ